MFRETLSPVERSNVVGVFYADGKLESSCFLFTDRLHCDNGEGSFYRVDLSWMRPRSFVASQSSLQFGPILEIGSRERLLYRLPNKWNDLLHFFENDLQKSVIKSTTLSLGDSPFGDLTLDLEETPWLRDNKRR